MATEVGHRSCQVMAVAGALFGLSWQSVSKRGTDLEQTKM